MAEIDQLVGGEREALLVAQRRQRTFAALQRAAPCVQARGAFGIEHERPAVGFAGVEQPGFLEASRMAKTQ